jgi:hypothetical protein
MTMSEACWFKRTAPPVGRWERRREWCEDRGEWRGEDEGKEKSEREGRRRGGNKTRMRIE